MIAETLRDLPKRRLKQAKEELNDAKFLYKVNSFDGANNRAYYAIFHSMKAVLALELIDFKRQRNVLAYFNRNYINTEIFPKEFGKRILEAKEICEYSEDDEFVASLEITKAQIETAEELINLVEKYMESGLNK